MTLPDFSRPINFIITCLLFFTIVFGRYLLIAGIFYAIFYKWFPEKFAARKINNRNYKPLQFRKEVGWSIITAVIFSLAGVFTLVLWQQGYTKIYVRVDDYPLWYLPLSVVISMLIHETYYYWVHRWMHNPRVFAIVHKVHHDSNITSPFTAFSFHPIEGLLQAIVLPATLMILPMHVSMILLQLTLMTFSSVINHLDIEIYPRRFQENILGRWLIGATHHSLHHKQFKYNYGLYFTIWDKLRKTESPLYKSLFKEKTLSKRASSTANDPK